MLRNPWTRVLLILLFAGILGVFGATKDGSLPQFFQQNCPPHEEGDAEATRWFKDRCLSLGLDLAGGTQLRYRIDLGGVPVEQHDAVVDGIRQVFDRRVNALGVSEPIVTPSTLNNQNYLTVELPGTRNIQEAIERVGRTVLLEFKEQRLELTAEEIAEDEAFNARKQQLAREASDRARTEDFAALRREVSELVGGRGGAFTERFREGDLTTSVPENLRAALFEELEPGGVSDVIPLDIQTTGPDGQVVDVVAGYSVVKLDDRREVERQIYEPARATVTHILVAFQGAVQVDPSVERSKDEARALAEDLLGRANGGADFQALVTEHSDDPSKTQNRGTFVDQVVGEDDPTHNAFVKEFNDAIVAAEPGQIVGPVETAFGYHVIRLDGKREKIDRGESRPQVDYQEIFFATRLPSEWRETGLTGGNLVRAIAQPVPNSLIGYEVSLIFDAEGQRLFGEITTRNVNKPVAIFLDGRIISEPVVQQPITNGEAVITGNFDARTATTLARDLNTGALDAPVHLIDQRQVEASLGGVALAESLRAGMIGLIILLLFLIAYYRLPGLIAATALILYALLLVALFRVWPGYTLTLAGIAGVILSIGMATDANVLIFERMREELRAGKSLHLAIEHGFKRAWSSIRDSNVSSLITAAILTFIGTSVVRGFALTLAIGILVSMFTAITITRVLLLALMRSPLGEKPALWTSNTGAAMHLPYMRWRKQMYIVSAALFILAAGYLATSGARLGQDFTGGASIELRFPNGLPATTEIRTALAEVETSPAAPEVPGFVQQTEAPAATPAPAESPFANAQIIPSTDNTVVLKTKAIDQEVYQRLVDRLAALHGGEPLEELRFETTGPTIGEGLRRNTWRALFWAVVLMVLYIAFAFRRVPAVASPWRFGVTAVVALVHDIFITIGFFAIMSRMFGWEIDTLFVTAMLTVFGFSVHDTIVVFDRIRENLMLHGREKSISDIADDSLNQTLARSIITSVTTMVTLAALALWGADSIRPFVVAMLFGIGLGTYSSIFVATPLLVDWQKHRLGRLQPNR